MAKFSCNFISYTLGRTVDVTVVVPSPTIPESMAMPGMPHQPPSHTKAEKYPVLYLLHGMGNNHATWSGYTNVEMYAEERNIIVVMPSGENKSYANQPSGDRHFDFIHNELPDFVQANFPALTGPEHTYIAGLSMGGYGTLIHALNDPGRYCALGAFSAATSINPTAPLMDGGKAGPAPDEYDPRKLADKIKAEGKAFPKMYIACGEADFLFADNQEFRDKMQALGADVTWVQTPGLGHEWRFWNAQVEAFLDWIPRTDSYAGTKRQI